MEYHVELILVIEADDIVEAEREADAFIEGNEREKIMWTTISEAS